MDKFEPAAGALRRDIAISRPFAENRLPKSDDSESQNLRHYEFAGRIGRR